MDVRTRTVAEVMRTEVATLTAGERLDLAEDIMRVGRVRHMPVVDGKRLVGIVSSRDLLAASLSRVMEFEPAHRRAFLRSVSVDEAMTNAPLTATRETPLAQAAALMLEQQIGCLPVVDSDGLLLGIVTESDLVRVAFLDGETAGTHFDLDEARRSIRALPGRLRDELEAVRCARDELRVQLHLAQADARDLWQELEDKWHELERRTAALAREAEAPAHEAREVVENLVGELRRGYQRIKKSLGR